MVGFSVMREPVTVDWTIVGDTKELNIHGAYLVNSSIARVLSSIQLLRKLPSTDTGHLGTDNAHRTHDNGPQGR